MENVVKIVYYIIFAWSLCIFSFILVFIAKVVYGEILYWTEKGSEDFY